MKKIMFLLAAVLFSTATFAQESTAENIPVKKNRYVMNRFWDNWFIDFGGEWMTNYSSQEKGYGYDKNPFARFRGNGGFDVSAGKWATPNFGMRAKIIAAWGRQVNFEDNGDNPLHNGLSVAFEPMVNLNNLFCGYKPRVWNFITYGTVGYYRDFTDKCNSPVVGLGFINQFNVTKRFHINIDLYGRFGDANMDGLATQNESAKLLWDSRDWQIGWSLGCGFNLGRVGWDNAPDVDAIMVAHKARIDALNASLAKEQEENERLQGVVKDLQNTNAVATVPEKDFATMALSVFFNLNKTNIASRKDLVDVKEMAEFAKANDKTVVVTGYADSRTGNPTINQKLSDGRAQTVVNELVKMGVSRDKIEYKGCGGVNTIAPYQYNRRVIVTLK